MTSTNTAMPTPTCENCGRDKTPTYICDACCDKLNAITRKRATDYAKLEAECEACDVARYAAELALAAASPWRYDVENAPKDGTNILLYWNHPLLDGTKITRYMRWDGGVWTDGDLSVTGRWVIAFATINQPENDNGMD